MAFESEQAPTALTFDLSFLVPYEGLEPLSGFPSGLDRDSSLVVSEGAMRV
jgi:hypothetical protein